MNAQFNPTKLLIDGCAGLGLVSNRKRATGVWERAKLARALPIKKSPMYRETLLIRNCPPPLGPP